MANNPKNWEKNETTGEPIPPNMQRWNEIQQNAGDNFVEMEAVYADQIPPFDIAISFQNEYGQAASMALLGVEILNEGSGMSIDDITTEKACTFVARGLTHIKPLE